MKTPLLLCVGVLVLSTAAVRGSGTDVSLIFPPPQEIQHRAGIFTFDNRTPLLLPEHPTKSDVLLVHLLTADLADFHGLAPHSRRTDRLPTKGRFVLLGTPANPLVRAFVQEHGLRLPAKAESYVLDITPRWIVVAGSDSVGAFYGLQSLRQLLLQAGAPGSVPCVAVRDWPALPFRGIRLYIPGENNLPFFRRFVANFMALFKFNRLILETNACVRFDRHPELNEGWRAFADDLNSTQRSRPRGPHGEFQDSAHHDAGDGGVLEKDQVRSLVAWARTHYLDVIPEIPTLTHTYYLLTRHRELAEIQDAEWPDTYCPSNPGSYSLAFDVLDELVDVIQPRLVHIGHDEWRMPMDVCPRCRGKDYRLLFAEDVRRIVQHLRERGVGAAMWGDHLLETVRKRGSRTWRRPDGTPYRVPGALSPEQVRELIPKDILIFNWFWGDPKNDSLVQAFGFRQVYGNLRPTIADWEKRRRLPGVLGGAPSSWAATTEFNIGKDLLYDFLGCAELLWTGRKPDPGSLAENVWAWVPTLRRLLSGRALPSEKNNPVVPLSLASVANAGPVLNALHVDLSALQQDSLRQGNRRFRLVSEAGAKVVAVTTAPDSFPDFPVKVASIPVGKNVNSLIFLHACARPGRNDKAYRMIYNFHDTAELLGWYEVVYEDGFVATVPVRYGVNILEWDVRQRLGSDTWPQGHTGSPQGRYCYQADPVDCSAAPQQQPITFFAFEWPNPRPGKVVAHVNVCAARGFTDYRGKRTAANAILLAALSATLPRPPEAVRATSWPNAGN
ncbi:MAG: family 20 glycosylhydrolase [Calditrichaeota bacterium]|nr:family 20 glycosylhydrolase [Calditrichota bacterium]